MKAACTVPTGGMEKRATSTALCPYPLTGEVAESGARRTSGRLRAEQGRVRGLGCKMSQRNLGDLRVAGW